MNDTNTTPNATGATQPAHRFRGTLAVILSAPSSDISQELCEWANERTGTEVVSVGERMLPLDDCTTCEHCSEIVESDDAATVRTGRRRATEEWCESCRNSDAFTCADCGEEFHENLACGCNTSEETVCEGCAESYFYCEGCNCTCSQDSYGEGGRCSDCTPSEDEAGIPEYHSQSRCYRPGVALKFGVELELKASDTEDCRSILELAEGRSWIAERDGSLDAELGIEVVAPPLSLGENLEQWGEVLSSIRRSSLAVGWDAGKNYGMHVSINRKALSAFHQGKLLVFVNGEQGLCERVAGRSEVSWARYVKKSVGFAKCSSGEKYEALSLRSESRMEMRIFRSTTSKEGFARNVEFVAACVEFTRSAGVCELRESSFLAWLSKPDNCALYPSLFAHLFPTATSERKARQSAFVMKGGK